MHLGTAYDLNYRADMCILILRWQRSANFEELQATYWVALDLAQHHRCGRWLFDARRREQLDHQFMSWLAGYFMGKARQQLAPARFKLGIISSPCHLAHFSRAIAAFQAIPIQLPQSPPCQAYVSAEEGLTLRWLLADDEPATPETTLLAVG